MVVLERTHGDIELTDGNLFKDGAVKMIAVDNIDVPGTAGGWTGQFVGEVQFSLEDRDVGPCFNQSSAILVPMGVAPTMMTRGCSKV